MKICVGLMQNQCKVMFFFISLTQDLLPGLDVKVVTEMGSVSELALCFQTCFGDYCGLFLLV
jgi:hypothetical protein